MIKQEPENLRWKVQLAQEFRSVKKWNELYEFCKKCVEETKNKNSKYENYDIGTFYAGAIESLLFLQRYEEGLKLGNLALQDHRMSPMCHAYIYLASSSIYFNMENWEKAEEYVYKYQKICKEIKKDPVKMEEQKTALLVGEILDAIPMKRSYSILISCGLKRRDISLLNKYADKLEWEKEVVYAYDGLVDTLMEVFAQMPYEPIFGKMADLAWNNPGLQKKLYVRAMELGGGNKEEHKRILRVLSQIEGNHWYLWYAKVLTEDAYNNGEQIHRNLWGYFENSINIFLTPQEISEIVIKYDFSLEECLLSLPFEKWVDQLRETLSKISKEDIALLEAEFLNQKNLENIRYDYFFMRVSEAQMLFTVREDFYVVKKQFIRKFSEKTCAFYRNYYTKEANDEYLELLPEYAQAAFCIEKALSFEESEPKKFLEYLKLAVDTYKNIAEVIKSFIQSYGWEKEKNERKAKEEMRQLELQIKQQVYKAMEQKRYEDALTILNQLKNMKPNDLEVVELLLRARIGLLEEGERR